MPRRIVGGTSAVALLLLAVAYTYHFLYWNFDDTYIVFRIVRNLLNGDGWAFNAGEAHNASTSVLNTIVVALADASDTRREAGCRRGIQTASVRDVRLHAAGFHRRASAGRLPGEHPPEARQRVRIVRHARNDHDHVGSRA